MEDIRQRIFAATGIRVEKHDPIIISALLSEAVIQSHIQTAGMLLEQKAAEQLAQVKGAIEEVSLSEKQLREQFLEILKYELNRKLAEMQAEKESVADELRKAIQSDTSTSMIRWLIIGIGCLNLIGVIGILIHLLSQ